MVYHLVHLSAYLSKNFKSLPIVLHIKTTEIVKALVDFLKSLANLPFLVFWEMGGGGSLRFRVGRQLRFRGLIYMFDSNWSFPEEFTVFPGELNVCLIPLGSTQLKIFPALMCYF